MDFFNIISLFGGLALFLYGMRTMGDGLKKGSSQALKRAMEKVTNNPFMGFLLGLGVTAVIQSSTATIVLTSGLVGAGIITLHQSLGIILGANVGTTVTSQIIRLLDIDAGSSWINLFTPSTLAPLAAIIGILFVMVIHVRNSDTISVIAMGFAILFTGLLNMTAAVEPLSSSPAFSKVFISFSDNPFLGFLAGFGVAFLLQSSSATVGILQALSVTGQLTFGSIYAILLGIYIGDCVTTAIVCWIGAKANAKRTGIIHILFNLGKIALVFIVVTVLHRTGVFGDFWDSSIRSGGIANTHTIFNLASAVLLLPVCGVFERLSLRIVKDDPEGRQMQKDLEKLDKAFFNSPALALSGAHSVISSMASVSCASVSSAMNILRGYDRKAIEVIGEDETYLDELADHVSDYLIRLSPHVTQDRGNDELNFYIKCVSEFERIGDYALNLTENASELENKGKAFSEIAIGELCVLQDALNEIMGYAQTAFLNKDLTAARHIEPIEEVVDDMVALMRDNHLHRLREGTCNVDSGFIFLDVLVNCERISDQCSNVGVFTISLYDEQVAELQHDYIAQLHNGISEDYNREYSDARARYFDRLANLIAAKS